MKAVVRLPLEKLESILGLEHVYDIIDEDATTAYPNDIESLLEEYDLPESVYDEVSLLVMENSQINLNDYFGNLDIALDRLETAGVIDSYTYPSEEGTTIEITQENAYKITLIIEGYGLPAPDPAEEGLSDQEALQDFAKSYIGWIGHYFEVYGQRFPKDFEYDVDVNWSSLHKALKDLQKSYSG